MADCNHEIKVIVEDNTKPKGPKPPKSRETLINVVVLVIAFACLGMLNDVIWSIGDFASVFNDVLCCW